MGPDRNNYEIWFIDYLDGNLDDQQVEALMSFLRDNPDLKEELESTFPAQITSPSVKFPGKKLLRKSASDIDDNQFELLCIADLENDISEQQKAELKEIVAGSTSRAKIYEQIRSLKLIAPNAEFRYKYRLRRLTVAQKAIRYSFAGLSAAAVIIIALLVFIPHDIARQPDPSLASGKTTLPEKADASEPKAVLKSRQTMSQPVRPAVSENRRSAMPGLNVNQAPIARANEIATDSAANINIPEKVNISYIGFNQNVELSASYATTNLIAFNIPVIPEQEEPTSRLNGFIARVFRDKLYKNETPASGNLKAYEIADAGINGLNRLLGWNMSLLKNKDDKGEVKSVYFSSKLIKLNAPVKKVMPLP
jgi:hypothetical protein